MITVQEFTPGKSHSHDGQIFNFRYLYGSLINIITWDIT